MGCTSSSPSSRLEDHHLNRHDARGRQGERTGNGVQKGRSPKKFDHELELEIMKASSQLDDYSQIGETVRMLREQLEECKVNRDGYGSKKEMFIREMISRVVSVQNSHGNTYYGDRVFKTEALVKCADSALTALGVLDREEDGVKWYVKEIARLEELFISYIRKQPPLAWESLFASAFNMAIFLKYAGFEDINTAYNQIKKVNTLKNGQLHEKLKPLLEHASSIYKAPIITKEQIASIMADTSPTANVYGEILSMIEEKGKLEPTEEGRLFHRLSVAWIKHFNRDTNIKFPVPPRNVQIINALCICEWIYRTCSEFSNESFVANVMRFAQIWSSSNCRCLITQVGTGEGKSITIAFIAVYCVLVLGKRVHVLENNEGLLAKDYSQFEDFFKVHFDIKVAKADNSTPGAPHDKDPLLENAQVIYLTSRAMQTMYAHGIGHHPCHNVILIVDEVDDLIVDKHPNDIYGIPHAEKSVELKQYFDDLLDNDGEITQVVRDGETWAQCKSNYKLAKKKILGKDYVVKNGIFVQKINGRANPNSYALWLEILRYQEDRSYMPVYKSYYFVQSMPHLINAYDCVVGLSGSLGSESEANFLDEIYGAWSYIVPPFLDTCVFDEGRIVGKKTAKLLEDEVAIHTTRKQQKRYAIDLAMEKCEHVPVLIICENRADAQELTADTKRSLRKKMSNQKHSKLLGASITRSSEEFVQHFAEYDDENQEMDWNAIIYASTEFFPDTTMRRITITDPYGGRGFDFDVRDKYANEHGGMIVITMTIPTGRDWTQWKGRTARGDRNGQLAVVLSLEDGALASLDQEELGSCKIQGSSTMYTGSIIDKVLVYHNEKLRTKLARQSEETFKGQRLNELCDRYHEQFHPSNTTKGTVNIWPREGFEDNDNKLSDFLRSQENSTVRIEAFKASLKPPLEYKSVYPPSYGVEPYVIPPKNVSFLVDYSGSMRRVFAGSTLISQALENVVNLLQDFISDTDSVSFALFDHQYYEVFPLTRKNGGMFDQIMKSPAPKRGGTAFYDSLCASIEGIPEGGNNNWIVALTDGEDQHSTTTLSECINTVRKANLNIFLIGFMVNDRVGKSLASITREVSKDKIGRYVTASDKNALERAFADIATLLDAPLMLT